ncbi:MAG: T9SS type A sorting domain-containing protein [Chitinophagales bacterium]|jgi:hypothetical protein|nr:T9SS type A sorting domain-containing protein [Chitinophagales bacterium]
MTSNLLNVKQTFKSFVYLFLCFNVFLLAAQVNYTQDFAGGMASWTTTNNASSVPVFQTTSTLNCGATASVRGNLAFGDAGTFTSPNLGTSNGLAMTLSFQYKIIDAGTNAATLAADVGTINIQYQIASGSWITIRSIDEFNHNPSTACATISRTFTPPAGAMAIRFDVTSGSGGNNFYYFDEISTSQLPTPTCFVPQSVAVGSITANTAAVTFAAPVSGSPSAYQYEVRTSGAAGSGATGLVTSNSVASVSTISLTGLSANTSYQVYMRSDCGGGDYSSWTTAKFFLTAQDCIQPTGLTVSNITKNGAQFDWTSYGLPTGFEYSVSTSATSPTSGTSTGSATNSYTLASGLTANTKYYVFVRANCSGGSNSPWSESNSFTTLCDATALPYNEDMSSAILPYMPSCVVNENASGNAWISNNPNANGFTTTAMRYNANASIANAWFFTQGLNLTGGTKYRVNFAYGSSGSNETLQVAYGSDQSSAGMANIGNLTVNHDKKDTFFYFTPASSGTFYIGFQATSAANAGSLFVDDVKVDVAVCKANTQATVAASSQTELVNQCEADTDGWIYYSPKNNPNQLMFGIKGAGTAVIKPSITVGSLVSKEASNGYSQEHGMFLMKRYWNAELVSGSISNVDIRFFYDPTELTDAETARDNAFTAMKNANANSYSVKSAGVEWFKTVGTPYDATFMAGISGNKFPSEVLKLTGTTGVLNSANYVDFTGITSFSGGTGGFSFGPTNGSGNSLDLVWGEVKASISERGNKISWTTYDERNTDYFNLEFSLDNVTFMEVETKIPAKGYYSGESKYEAYHALNEKEIIYRVKQYDKDGKFSYSKKVSLASSSTVASKEFSLDILANPIQGDRLKMRIHNQPIGHIAKVKLYNLMGQEVIASQIALTAQTSDIALDCTSLSAGTYMMKYSDGVNQITQKVVR